MLATVATVGYGGNVVGRQLRVSSGTGEQGFVIIADNSGKVCVTLDGSYLTHRPRKDPKVVIQ